jgi:hypothetical protein
MYIGIECIVRPCTEERLQGGDRAGLLCAQSSTKGLAASLAQRGVSGERVLCLVPHVAPPLVEPPVVPRSAALHRLPASLVGCGLYSSLNSRRCSWAGASWLDVLWTCAALKAFCHEAVSRADEGAHKH